MRLTVGPLPPAVYWRRRAIVLGALLLFLTVVYSSCSGSTDSAAKQRNANATATPTTPATTVEPTASTPAPTAQGEPVPTSESPDGEGGDETVPPLDPGPQPPPAQDGRCTNAEMTVIPAPAKPATKAGTAINLYLKIRNASNRTCSRDVGADFQELRLVKGAQTIWSSDRCGPSRGSDLQKFEPGTARDFMVTWNGRQSTKCTAGAPSGPVPAAGAYQLLGRLGDKYSQPVRLMLR
jgi:hypothetical protein